MVLNDSIFFLLKKQKKNPQKKPIFPFEKLVSDPWASFFVSILFPFLS